MTAPANLALRQTTLDLRAPSRHDYAVSLDGPPCMSELPAETRPARLRVGASPRPPGARKPETELGAVSTTAVPHPDSRSGPSPHLQGRVMDEQRTVFVGIDVSKDRLDVHLRPSGEAFCVPREGKGMDDLVIRLQRLSVALVVLEATGGFEATVAAAWPALDCRSVSLTRARSETSPARWAAWPRPTRSTRR